MTEARLGYGTLIQRWSGAAWVTVAEQVTVSGPSLSSDDVEVTNHDSPNSTKEYIPALMDTGEISFNGNFIPSNASQQQLLTDQVNRTVSDWRIVLPDAVAEANRTRWSFEGYIKSIDFTYPTPTQMTINATMKLAGTATLASAYSDDLTALVVTGSASGALTLVPALAPSVYEYSVAAANGDATCTVTPTMATAEEIKVNGVVVASGAASGDITLAVGPNIITVKTTDADTTPTFYTLYVTRAAA